MTESEPLDSTSELIDSIAELVPEDLRAAYYRDMHHCHSLHASDEMLRIMKVIGWITVLTAQVPVRIAAQIRTLEHMFREHSEAMQALHQRLDRVSEELIERVSPEAVANQLYESLRQQFVKSAIPRTGQALIVVANHIQQAVAGLEQATPKITTVTATARQAIAELSQTFLHTYRWALIVFLVFAALLGFWGGVLAVQSGYWPK